LTERIQSTHFDTAIRKAKEKETDMTDETNKMNTLIAACWKDDALKQRFLSDPHAVLAEHGMDVPEGMNVNVVENTDNAVHVTLPAAPEGHAELSDEELESAAGGLTTSVCILSLIDIPC
jgi:hypothetical protein